MKLVIRERHNAMRPIWVTTWLDKEALVKRYGGSLIERLYTNAMTIHFEGSGGA
jgi:hypothetical protein